MDPKITITAILREGRDVFSDRGEPVYFPADVLKDKQPEASIKEIISLATERVKNMMRKSEHLTEIEIRISVPSPYREITPENTHAPTGKAYRKIMGVPRVVRLTWILQHWKEVASIEVKPRDTKRNGACVMIMRLKDKNNRDVFWSEWPSASMCWDFLHRPVFYGLPLCWGDAAIGEPITRAFDVQVPDLGGVKQGAEDE